ncbi:PLP-dependent transferase [Flagelloscypha sp. PMI_526]|nr:PLP-dependent transferase [Flagelloscypha sp. PMI_526]
MIQPAQVPLAPRAHHMLARYGLAAKVSPRDSEWPSSTSMFEENPSQPPITSLAVAENSLLSSPLLEKICHNFQMTPEHLKYRPALINSEHTNLTKTMPTFLNNTLKPSCPIAVHHILMGPGVGCMLSHLLWSLCSPGEGVVLTCPFYADYDKNITWPSEARFVPVDVPSSVDTLSCDVLPIIEQTLRNPLNRAKVLLLTNPHNPLARAYPEEVIKGYAALAEEFNIHLIVDEVFANQVFPSKYAPNPTPFKSILSFPPSTLSCNPSRIHVLAGPSKDLGASGVKIGCLISQNNPDLLLAVASGMSVTPLSSASDAVFSSLLNLENGKFIEEYLDENRRVLSGAFELLGRWCEAHGLDFVKSEAGVFSLVDFAPFVERMEGDLPLQFKVESMIEELKKGGVILRSSTAFRDPTPTRLRVVFSSPAHVMKEAFHRIETALNLPHVILNDESTCDI